LLFCASHVALGVTVAPSIVRPANNDCDKAQPVGDAENLAFDTSRATFDGPGHFMHSPNVWYCYTATCTGDATISLAGSDFDTKLAVYDGCGCYPAGGDLIEGNDDFHAQQSEVTFSVTAGNRYLIEVGGYNQTSKGRGVINISCDGQGCKSDNDECRDAQPVDDVTDLQFDTSCATFDGPGHCMASANIWYHYRAVGSGAVTVSLGGSSFDTKLAVYEGANCYPALASMLECNDDFGNSLSSQITFQATAGGEYLIEVGGYSSDDVGPGVLNIVSDLTTPPASKDNCLNAISIGDVTNLTFDTRNGTFDGPGLCLISANIWYCYTASCTGDVTVSLAGSSYDTMLAVYNGCECYPVSADMIECNDDANASYQSEITFAAVAGNQYLIEIGGYGAETGQGVLNVSCEGETGPPASKDDCINAKFIGDVTNVPFDTTNATFDGPGLCLNGPNIWYRYTASCTGEASVSLLGSGFDTKLAAYKGANCYPAQSDLLACNDDSNFSYQSQVFFAVTAGNQYLIEIGGYASETGQGVLTISCDGTTSADQPDLGDAPDSTNNSGKIMGAYPFPSSTPGRFPTVFDDGSGVGPYGPAHLNDQPVAFLGKVITGEAEADIGPDADGVNNLRSAVNSPNHDGGDDAVELPLSLPNCGWAAIDYEVTVVAPGVNLWVNVWLDFNRDGDWDDTLDCPGGSAREWAVRNQFLFDLPAGLSQITTPAFLSSHPTNAAEQIWMRITLSERPWTGGSNPGQPGNAGSGPVEKYQIGETEDYYFIPRTTGQGECPLCEDVNGDGTVNMEDLAAHVSLWLANCQ
jgi:hypothetical protein